MVAGVHTDLIVTRESVHEAEEFVTGRSVYYEINPRQGEAILLVGLIDVFEIDAKPSLVVFFFDENNVGQPFWVLYFSDYLCLKELTDLFIDRLLSFWGKTLSLLLDWLTGGIGV